MKTVLITGANRGIGLEHTRRFADRCIRVFATPRTPAQATELMEQAEANSGCITVLPYDAGDPGAPARLKAAVGRTPIDLLFSSAGIMGDKTLALGVSGGLKPHKSGGGKWLRKLAADSGGRFRSSQRHQ